MYQHVDRFRLYRGDKIFRFPVGNWRRRNSAALPRSLWWKKWKFWLPIKSKPLKGLTKFVRINHVRERNVSSKCGKNPLTGDFWAKVWNITFVWLFYLFFFSDPSREETPGRIVTRNCSKDAKSRKNVRFEVIKWKIEIWPLFTPQTLRIWPWIGNL